MDIRLKTVPYTFDGQEMTLCCNMNVLADVQEYFDGSFGRALEKRRTLKANIVFLTAMINDYFDSMSLPARGAWIEIWKEMQAVRSVMIEACLYAIIDYYVTYAEEKPKGYTPHTNSGTHFGY